MPAGASTPTLRKVLDDRLSQLIPDVESWVEGEAAARAAAGRRHVSECLNQAVRRLAETRDFSAAAAVLAETSSAFSRGAAVFRAAGETVRGERARGLDEERANCLASLEFPAAAAPAFAAALAGSDPVVALGSAGEVSPAVADLFQHEPGERVALFPIAPGGKAAGILYCWGEPEMAALELLAKAAGLALAAAVPAAPQQAPGLVAIAPAEPAQERRPPAPDWAAMAPADRQIHLRAQRFARVQVAEMRLYRADVLKDGRARGEIYAALREFIDAARDTYKRQFLAAAPALPDYLHEELLRTLANDDPALLGKEYPGPLA